MSNLKPYYLLIAGSDYAAEKIRWVYQKNRLLFNFDLDVAFSCCHVAERNNKYIIYDPCWQEVKDPVVRQRWYMPPNTKIEINQSAPVAMAILKWFAAKQYDAIINACPMGPNGNAEFWYMLESANIKPKKTKALPIGSTWDDDVIQMALMMLRNN